MGSRWFHVGSKMASKARGATKWCSRLNAQAPCALCENGHALFFFSFRNPEMTQDGPRTFESENAKPAGELAKQTTAFDFKKGYCSDGFLVALYELDVAL